MSQEDMIRLSKYWDLAGQPPPVEWSKAYWILQLQDILKKLDGPKGVFADPMPVPGGGRMIQRTPNDPNWYQGVLYKDDKRINVPGLWSPSRYDTAPAPSWDL